MGWFAITVVSVLCFVVAVEGVAIYLLALATGKMLFDYSRFQKAVYQGFAATDKNFLNVGKTFHNLALTMADMAGTDVKNLPDLPPPTNTSGSLMN